MNEFKYEIIMEIGILSENKEKGTRKELNIISWNGGNPKLDLREWSNNHDIIGRGITLTFKEYNKLVWLFMRAGSPIAKLENPSFYSEE